MANYKHFNIKQHNQIWICYFQNKEYGNSFSKTCAQELESILKDAVKNKIKGLLVTNTDRTFCSGGNLKDYAKLNKKSQGITINKYISKVLAQFEKAPFPTVLSLTGDCLGGGIEWLSTFDKVIASPQVLLGMWQSNIALSWGWGGGKHLKKRVSTKALKNLLLEGKTFSAYEALDLGLIDAIYPSKYHLTKSLEYLESFVHRPHEPTKMIKIMGLEKEQKLFESLWMNAEHKKILSKFLK